MTPTTRKKLERRFAIEFDRSIRSAPKARVSFPHRTVQMRASIGDVPTAVAIICRSANPSYNAWAFKLAGMIDLTVEALVICHRRLFHNDVVRMAIARLRRLQPPRPPQLCEA